MDYKQYILELLAPVGEALKLDDPYPTLIERLKKCDEKCTEAMEQEQQLDIKTIMRVIKVMNNPEGDQYSINNLAVATKLMIEALQN